MQFLEELLLANDQEYQNSLPAWKPEIRYNEEFKSVELYFGDGWVKPPDTVREAIKHIGFKGFPIKGTSKKRWKWTNYESRMTDEHWEIIKAIRMGQESGFEELLSYVPETRKEHVTVEEVLKDIAGKAIEMLEKGIVPWKSYLITPTPPTNVITGQEYTGRFNRFILSCALRKNSFDHHLWVGEGQIAKAGGKVKPGQRGFLIYRPQTVVVPMEDSTRALQGNKEENEPAVRTFVRFRVSIVYNVDQCELPEGLVKVERKERKFEEPKRIVVNFPNPPLIQERGFQPFYDPKEDRVVVPKLEKFKNEVAYWIAYFHELAHATGHSKRLHRPSLMKDKMYDANHAYSLDEVIAEMTAACLAEYCGVQTPDGEVASVTYIAFWMNKLKQEPAILGVALRESQRAVQYILGKEV